MKVNKESITKLMYLSGISNISGALIFSRFFTNNVINEADPVVMSDFGLIMIVIWGLAFIAMAAKWEQLKWLIAAFAVEKFIYGFIWIRWLLNNDLSSVYEQDIMAGIFYTIYGPNDWFFCLFYLYIFSYLCKTKK